MFRPFEIIKELKLDDYLKIVLKESSSNSAPYHNFYHVMCKIKNTYDIAKSLGYSLEKIRILIIVDLWHDFNHSMGKQPDSWNVAEAKKQFLIHSKETDEVNQLVLAGIDATEFPYTVKEEDLTLDQKIIRDSDLLQQYEDNYIQQIYFGLSQELPYTFEQLLIGYPQFISGMKLYTHFAKEIAKSNNPSREEDINYLTNLLNK